MKIVLFVHDLFISIGHSNAIIEKLNNLPEKEVQEIICVCYTHQKKEEIFTNLHHKVRYIKVPFPNLKPFLFKAIFYQFYTLVVSLILRGKGFKKISIGVASLSSDIVDLQFVHRHFKDYFFEYKKLSGISLYYKKLLFLFYHFSESISFWKSKKYLALSGFVRAYMIKEFKIKEENVQLAYSSVNQKRFYYLDKNKKSLLNNLVQEYPDLSSLDLEKTIYLFVGAFERKGLKVVLDKITFLEDPQIIIIGKPEQNSDIVFPENVNCIHIPFTKRLNEFYNLADHFLFPTVYEPYGLVILEAFACGMYISTTIENVGASEILKEEERIYLYKDQKHFQVQDSKPLTLSERKQVCENRQKLIEKISWKNASDVLYKMLTL
jgi:hypothetical protein